MPFFTEKVIEESLQTETRLLPMPDGQLQPFQGFKVMWDTLDALLTQYDMTLEWYVEQALLDGKEMGRAFWLSFPNIVGYVHDEFKKAFGD